MTLDLFGATAFPEGFAYKPATISLDEERSLLGELERLPFEEFDFHGFLGKRRVVSYGWKYDFEAATLRRSDPVPEFLLPIGDRAARARSIETPTCSSRSLSPNMVPAPA